MKYPASTMDAKRMAKTSLETHNFQAILPKKFAHKDTSICPK